MMIEIIGKEKGVRKERRIGMMSASSVCLCVSSPNIETVATDP